MYKMSLAIDVNTNSGTILNCFLAVVPTEAILLRAVSKVCMNHDKKHIFAWSNISDGESYLEDVRKRSLFCWFLLIFELFDYLLPGYNIKLVCSPERMIIAHKAIKYYQDAIKKF